MAKLRLIYFNLMGRAEVARIALDLGGIAYQDVRLTMEQWAEFKPKTPYGQLPVLEVAGKIVAQSAAISRYCAKLAGLVPSDDFKAALCDETYEAAQDVQALLYPTLHVEMEEADKLAARKNLVEGDLGDKLAALDKRLGELAPGEKGHHPYVGGDKPSHGDLAVLYMCAWLTSGIIDGIPREILQPYPHLEAMKERLASLPAIRKRYENKHDPMSRAMEPTTDFFASGNHPPRRAERKAAIYGQAQDPLRMF